MKRFGVLYTQELFVVVTNCRTAEFFSVTGPFFLSHLCIILFPPWHVVGEVCWSWCKNMVLFSYGLQSLLHLTAEVFFLSCSLHRTGCRGCTARRVDVACVTWNKDGGHVERFSSAANQLLKITSLMMFTPRRVSPTPCFRRAEVVQRRQQGLDQAHKRLLHHPAGHYPDI